MSATFNKGWLAFRFWHLRACVQLLGGRGRVAARLSALWDSGLLCCGLMYWLLRLQGSHQGLRMWWLWDVRQCFLSELFL